MTNRTAATRYARAVLDVAIKEQANLEQIERELVDFAALLDAQPVLKKVLLNPAVPVPRKPRRWSRCSSASRCRRSCRSC
jgi:F0F1-type ATP synthase delta subunit